MKKVLSIAALFVAGSIMMSASCRHTGCPAYGNKMRAEKTVDQETEIMALSEEDIPATTSQEEVEG